MSEEAQAPIEEVTLEVFESMSASESRSLIDWEAVWERVNGKIVSRKRFEEIVNEVRGTPGKQLWWGVFDSALKRWREAGKAVEERWGMVGNKKKKFFKFGVSK